MRGEKSDFQRGARDRPSLDHMNRPEVSTSPITRKDSVWSRTCFCVTVIQGLLSRAGGGDGAEVRGDHGGG